MQVIPALSNITTTPHIFETPEDIIINGQIYDKATMKPKPYHFANLYNMADKFNLFNESVNRFGDKSSMPDKGIDYSYILQDSEDKNIFYALCHTTTASSPLFKFEKKDNTYNFLQTATYTQNIGVNSANTYKFLCQTKDYIVITETHYSNTNGFQDLRNIAIRRISKNDLSSVYIAEFELYTAPSNGYLMTCFGSTHYVIKSDESYMYIYRYNGVNASISKYNILNNTITHIYEFSDDYISANSIGISNIIEFNNKYYIITGNNTFTSYELQEIIITDKDNVVINHYPISHTNFKYDKSGFRVTNIGIIVPCLVYTLKNIDNKYIGLTIHHNEGGGAMKTNNKQILIKKTNNGFEITNVIDISNCYGVLYYNPYICVILTGEGYIFYKLNTDTDAWEKIREEAGTFNYIAFDSYKRFYTVDTENKVKIYSNVSAYNIDVHFEETSYKYENTNVQTNCLISAKNFLGEYIQTIIKVTLTGPVKFINGSTEKEIKTINGVLTEPIYIHGSGQIGINAIEVEA